MQFINPLYLISISSKTDDDVGDIIKSEIKRKVYCDINSIRQSEFYQAQAIGAKPEISVIIRAFEYADEVFAELNNIRYKILRTYDKGDGLIELILTRGVDNGNT
ncbi:MAG: phage head-tail adapter protein [Clostridiales bacterium]|nr:phage head-tail adapter protein [Clostridiales bacterium]